MEYSGPRERLLNRGPAALGDGELLAVMLRTGVSREKREKGGLSVMELANSLIGRFGNLKGVINATPEELQTFCGIGPGKLATVLCIKEITQRLWKFSQSESSRLDNPRTAFCHFYHLSFEHQEVVWAAYLNSQNRIIRMEEVFRGTLEHAIAQPREILRQALRVNAAKLVLAHNHPSGCTSPSTQDKTFTSHLKQASKIVGVHLLDHLIVGEGGSYFSFLENKLM